MWRCGIAYNSQPIQTLQPLSQYSDQQHEGFSASILIYIFINLYQLRGLNLLLLINNRTKVKYYFLINFSQTLFRPYFIIAFASFLHFTSLINLQNLFISLKYNAFNNIPLSNLYYSNWKQVFVNVVHSIDRSGEQNIPHRLSGLQKLRPCEANCFQ